MRWSRRSRNWTSFSPPLARAWEGHEVVDLPVGRLTISGFNGTGMPRCVLYSEAGVGGLCLGGLGGGGGRVLVVLAPHSGVYHNRYHNSGLRADPLACKLLIRKTRRDVRVVEGARLEIDSARAC